MATSPLGIRSQLHILLDALSQDVALAVKFPQLDEAVRMNLNVGTVLDRVFFWQVHDRAAHQAHAGPEVLAQNRLHNTHQVFGRNPPYNQHDVLSLQGTEVG